MKIWIGTLISVVGGVLTLAFASPAWSCSCMPIAEDFFTTVSEHNRRVKDGQFPEKMALTVVTAKVLEYKQHRQGPVPTEMVLEVDNVIQGQASRRIEVEGDNGVQCRPYVTNFPIGTTWAFAVDRTGEGGNFAISVCGVYSKQTEVPGQSDR